VAAYWLGRRVEGIDIEPATLDGGVSRDQSHDTSRGAHISAYCHSRAGRASGCSTGLPARCYPGAMPSMVGPDDPPFNSRDLPPIWMGLALRILRHLLRTSVTLAARRGRCPEPPLVVSARGPSHHPEVTNL